MPNGDPPTRPPRALLDLIAELEPNEIVLGIPLRMDGTAGDMAREARAFGRELAEQTGLSVVEWDERLSTTAAERELRQAAPKRVREEKGLADMVAAALLLRSYLQRRAGP